MHFHFQLVAREAYLSILCHHWKEDEDWWFYISFLVSKMCMFFKTGCYCIGEDEQKRERFKIAMFKKEVPDFPCLAKCGDTIQQQQRNVLFFFEQFERIFAYQFFLHVFTRRKTVCVKNVLLLNDGHLSRNTLASRVSNFSIICSSSSLTHEIFI